MSIIRIDEGVVRNPEWRMNAPVSLTIDDGMQIAVVGDNAAGKTRLVEILTGHYPLLLNEVHYDFSQTPRPLISDNLKYITFRDSYGESDGTYYLQQRWNQHDIDENTPTVGQLLSKIPEAVPGLRERLYSMFHMESLLDEYIISISSGELRKFQLTRVLLTAPHVLVMDNPYIGLDAEARDLLTGLFETMIKKCQLLCVLILSRDDMIPHFVTHIVPVEGLNVLPMIRREEYSPRKHWRETSSHEFTTGMTSCKTQVMQPEILRFTDVTIRYGERTILKNLNWVVRQGERWALRGENGAGKSTLLSLVTADNPQGYACDISLFGRKRGTGESIWDIKKRIGYVSPELHRAYQKDIPAIDIVASGLSDSVGLYHRPTTSEREKCLVWMKRFGIEAIASRTFLKLSSGEQRLCLLARAFVKQPDLLILDEPLHGLDLGRCLMVQQIIDEYMQDCNKTLIMVSHYAEELPPCITHEKFLKRN
ncbi:MAG: ATP-binding cassette domain-containing protein [Bacteroidaceae bacterium]|nr:ATP-binding cassette domain-containing protein [Bacteroidaceae bacterium]